MTQLKIDPLFSQTICAKPRCSCPQLSVIIGESGEYEVHVKDDFLGSIQVTPDEMALISKRFMSVYDTGAYDKDRNKL